MAATRALQRYRLALARGVARLALRWAPGQLARWRPGQQRLSIRQCFFGVEETPGDRHQPYFLHKFLGGNEFPLLPHDSSQFHQRIDAIRRFLEKLLQQSLGLIAPTQRYCCTGLVDDRNRFPRRIPETFDGLLGPAGVQEEDALIKTPLPVVIVQHAGPPISLVRWLQLPVGMEHEGITPHGSRVVRVVQGRLQGHHVLVARLFDSLRKQIRQGYFRLPNALPQAEEVSS